jgi:hypothetical protein
MGYDVDTIDKIIDLSQPKLVEIGGEKYSDRNLHLVKTERFAKTIALNTLDGLVDYLKHNRDGLELETLSIIINKYNSVLLAGSLTDLMGRQTYVDCSLSQEIKQFPFGSFMDVENFIINVHSLIEDNEKNSATEGKEYVLSYVKKIRVDDSSDIEDDGITQNITLAKGVSGKLREKDELVNIVKLKPFRTFRELSQPESQFLLRVKWQSSIGVTVALFEADGGAWMIEAKKRIKAYLIDKLGDDKVSILS